jgi:hypothetical protein
VKYGLEVRGGWRRSRIEKRVAERDAKRENILWSKSRGIDRADTNKQGDW